MQENLCEQLSLLQENLGQKLSLMRGQLEHNKRQLEMAYDLEPRSTPAWVAPTYNPNPNPNPNPN